MSGRRMRFVSPRPGGGWGQKAGGAKRSGSTHRTQAAAIRAARATLRKSGGGELVIRNAKGRIRAKDTIAPARDPRRTRG